MYTLSLSLSVTVTTLYARFSADNDFASPLYEYMVYKSASPNICGEINYFKIVEYLIAYYFAAPKKIRFIGTAKLNLCVASGFFRCVAIRRLCPKLRQKAEIRAAGRSGRHHTQIASIERPIIGGSSSARRETPGKGANSLMHYKRGRMDMEIASTLGARHPRVAMSYLHKYT